RRDLCHGSRLRRLRSASYAASCRCFFRDPRQEQSRCPARVSAPVDRTTGLVCDQTIALNGFDSARNYPAHLRRIRFKDPDTGKTLVFLTNNFTLPAITVCALYKSRWQIELFFKWILCRHRHKIHWTKPLRGSLEF